MDAAHLFGNILAIWFTDQKALNSASMVRLSASGWGPLRGLHLLAKARVVRDLAQTVLASEQAPEAEFYGVTPAELLAFEQRVDSYDKLIASPQQRIAVRKAYTAQLPGKFRQISQQLEVLDKLVLSFRRSEGGREFVAVYQASRTVRDLGRRGSASPEADSTAQKEATFSK